MRPTFTFGRIAGVSVGAHWSALVGMVVLGTVLSSTALPQLAPGATPVGYGVAGAVGAVALIGSLLVHELTHAVVARRCGLPVRRITLWLLGGVSELGVQPGRPTVELRVALAGPLASLGLGALAAAANRVAAVAGAPALVTATLSWLATVNILLGVFNLLPGFPLDGGRVLHGLLWWRSGDRLRATRAATGAGQLLGSLLAALGLLMALAGRWDGLWLVMVGWFLTGAAAGERRYATTAEQLQGLTAADAMTRQPQVAPGWWTVQAFADSLRERHRRDGTAPRHRTFPVVDVNGRPVGVVRLADLARVAPADRGTTTVRQLAQPCRDDMLVPADEPLERLAARRLLLAGGLLLVRQENGTLAGVLSAADLATVAALHALDPHELHDPQRSDQSG